MTDGLITCFTDVFSLSFEQLPTLLFLPHCILLPPPGSPPPLSMSDPSVGALDSSPLSSTMPLQHLSPLIFQLSLSIMSQGFAYTVTSSPKIKSAPCPSCVLTIKCLESRKEPLASTSFAPALLIQPLWCTSFLLLSLNSSLGHSQLLCQSPPASALPVDREPPLVHSLK